VLVILVQKLAIEDLVEIELYQILSKTFTIFQPSDWAVVYAKVCKLG